jgi:hypothetical protein
LKCCRTKGSSINRLTIGAFSKVNQTNLHSGCSDLSY